MPGSRAKHSRPCITGAAPPRRRWHSSWCRGATSRGRVRRRPGATPRSGSTARRTWPATYANGAPTRPAGRATSSGAAGATRSTPSPTATPSNPKTDRRSTASGSRNTPRATPAWLSRPVRSSGSSATSSRSVPSPTRSSPCTGASSTMTGRHSARWPKRWTAAWRTGSGRRSPSMRPTARSGFRCTCSSPAGESLPTRRWCTFPDPTRSTPARRRAPWSPASSTSC
jgi:hypothetical protein